MLGEKIKNLRKLKRMRQDELAEILGVTRSQISVYETGRGKPSYAVLIKMSEFFNKPLDYFYEQSEQPVTDFIRSLELSDQEFLRRVALFYKGEKLTDDEVKKLLSYLRFLKSSDNK